MQAEPCGQRHPGASARSPAGRPCRPGPPGRRAQTGPCPPPAAWPPPRATGPAVCAVDWEVGRVGGWAPGGRRHRGGQALTCCCPERDRRPQREARTTPSSISESTSSSFEAANVRYAMARRRKKRELRRACSARGASGRAVGRRGTSGGGERRAPRRCAAPTCFPGLEIAAPAARAAAQTTTAAVRCLGLSPQRGQSMNFARRGAGVSGAV